MRLKNKQEENKKYYEKNREKIRASQKKYYKENRERLLAAQNTRSKKYYEENREKILEKSKYRYNNNINGARDRKSTLFRQRYKRNRLELLELLGGAVCECGFDDIRALEIDHKNGGGNEHRKAMSSHTRYAEYIKSHLEEFQVLCANCHSIKTHENNEAKSRNVAI